ncbi:hypothetical protein [Halosegnis marinus]|uniref:hypothetical protein n=1 Tax=Halosegnis marinus TaxID=3034023 RepID=UPI0036084516
MVPLLFAALLVAAPMAMLPGVAAAGTPAADGHDASNTNETLAGFAAVTGVATAGDGGEYLVGAESVTGRNTTLVRRGPDGETRWRRTFGSNDTLSSGMAVASGPLPGAYVLERVVQGSPYDYETPPTLRLRRVAPDGETMWTKSLGNVTGYASAGDLLASPRGGVTVATGYLDREAERRGTRIRVVSPNGETTSDRRYDGGTPRSVSRTDDGGLVVAGEVSYGEGWVLRTDADGDVLVNASVGGPFDDRTVSGATATDDGGVLVGGSAETAFARSSVWAARLTAEGDVAWSRTFGESQRSYARAAVATDEGLLLLNDVDGEFRERGARLTHVTADGDYASRAVEGDTTVSATTAQRLRDDGTVALYGIRYLNRTSEATVRTAAVPTPENTAFRADAGVSTNATFLRGQNLELSGSATYGLYEVPGEYDDYDEPRRVRTLDAEDGEAVFETATLARGEYAIRNDAGLWLTVEDGEVTGLAGSADEAAFGLDEQSVRLVDRSSERRYSPPVEERVVRTYEGNTTVEFGVEARPANFTADVSLYRLRGGTVNASTTGEALSGDDGWGGTEAPTHVEIGDDADRNLTVDAGALDAGLYRVRVDGAETGEATDAGSTVLVVVREERLVSLTAADTSLTVPENGSATTNLTLAGVDNGIGALRFDANRSGGPAVGLRLDLTDAVEYGSARGSAGWSSDEATASTQSLEVRSAPNGSFVAATFTVEDSEYRDSGSGTNTADVGIAWVVDADGVPYSVPDDLAIEYEVAGDGEEEETDENGSERGGSASGSASA